MQSTILILDSDHKTRDLVSALLTYQGYNTTIVRSSEELLKTVPKTSHPVLVADLATLTESDHGAIGTLRSANPDLVIIVYGPPATASTLPAHVERLFFLSSPINLDELESLVMRAHEYQALKPQENSSTESYPHFLCSTIIGTSRQMMNLFELIEKVAESSATVLIHGESGTGKELAAKAIHQLSSRSSQNFVPVNCAAIPDDLLESELFGHVKGAFTGAHSNRIGRFEMADRGTMFLDEIGDMKPNLQVKLLRVLQSKEFEAVGSTKSQKVDVRIIAATNQNLEEMVAAKDFREDLFYRLSVIPINIPALRERRSDIPILINHFLGRFNLDKKRLVKGFSRDALDILCNYDWPGNVRELENLVERLVILKESGLITPEDLPEKYLSGRSLTKTVAQPASAEADFPAGGVCLNSAVEEFENRLISQALHQTGGNKKEAAELLNLKRTTLIEKLKKKNLQLGP
jgi:DNA-binding NtrC family response regulator